MRGLLLYWIMGCLIAGGAFGAQLKRCPGNEIDPFVLVAAVAVWPALFTAALIAPKMELPKCK
jgi:hypothetical protein